MDDTLLFEGGGGGGALTRPLIEKISLSRYIYLWLKIKTLILPQIKLFKSFYPKIIKRYYVFTYHIKDSFPRILK